MCFEGTYEGGKVAAMKRRRMLIEADPKRQEAKNKKKLARLKKKMEVMQRKKREEAEATANTVKAKNESENSDEEENLADSRKKRKREDEGGMNPVKGENDDEVDDNDAEEEEAALLESALDAIEGAAGVERRKTREEAELDRQKLLAGELLDDGEDEPDQGGGANAASLKGETMGDRKLTREEIEAEVLRRSGLVIVSDDEATVLGGNRILPWRHGYKRTVAGGVKKEEPPNDGGEDNKANVEEALRKPIPRRVRTTIKFTTKFDVVELDAGGRVIDQGELAALQCVSVLLNFCRSSFSYSRLRLDDKKAMTILCQV
jgi:hypothetical protein